MKQQTRKIAKPASRVTAPSGRRIDPHLLELNSCWGPRGRLGLELDDAALFPQPRAAFLDLDARAPAIAGCVPSQRIDPELLGVCGRTGREQEVEIVKRRRTQS